MGKIFCLMGKSASGKDTIYNRLLQMPELGLRSVVPYTTRPIRSGETDGETYFFCSEAEVTQMEREGKIIELRVYHTVCGDWKYFTADDGQICPEKQDYLLIGTLESYEKIRDYFGSGTVCPLYVWVDDGVRLQRALERERSQREPRYAEMCRRFLADEQDFSGEKLAEAGVRVRFENADMDAVVAELAKYIAQERKGAGR